MCVCIYVYIYAYCLRQARHGFSVLQAREFARAAVHVPPDRSLIRGSRLENNCFAGMCSGSEEGSYLRLMDVCITQLSAYLAHKKPRPPSILQQDYA